MHALLADARFYELLTKFDEDVAAQVRAQGCMWCGGRLLGVLSWFDHRNYRTRLDKGLI